MDEDYYDEGSDIDNYEDEQVFQDREGDDDEDDLKDDGWIIDYPIHEDSSFLDLSRGCD